MAAAPHPLAAAALLVLAPALVAVSAHPTGLPSAEDRVTARDPGFPAFPGFPGFFNPFYPQLPQLPAVPQLPPFPFFYPPILPYNLLDKPNGGLAGGVSSYNLGGSSSSGGGSSGGGSSGGSSSGSVTTYGLQSHNGQVTGGGLIVAANPNGTFTTYEIILRPINVTAIPGAAPTPVVSAPEVAPEAVAEVVPEAMTEAMTEAKKVANLASAAAAPAAEVAKLHAKTARRETEDGEGEPKGEDEAGEEKPEGGQEEATGEEEAPPEGESEVEEAGRSLAEAGEDYHLEDVEEAVPADEQA